MTSVFLADTPHAAAEAAADRLTAVIAAAREARSAAHVALAGGTTPRKTYELLASRIDDWTGVEVWFGDERAVGPDDPQSNYRMARETLLGPAGVPAGNVVRWRAEDPDLDSAARDYERGLTIGTQPPWLDLALLGLGPDGHTASLFPGTSALAEEEVLAVAVDVPQLGTRRLTLTYPALCGARDVCFLVTGRDKAPALASVVEAGHLPAARIARRDGPVTIFCDADAASALRGTKGQAP